ncbi:MAG: translation initiation factor IF-2 [Acidobacteria bacterium]|nr:translation initiation factor IF-2 [Acidobacteriota bacterium]
MAKVRVHELAKKAGLSSQELLEKLKAFGFDVKSNFSMVEESALEALKGGAKKARVVAPQAKKSEPQAAEPRKPQPAAAGGEKAQPTASQEAQAKQEARQAPGPVVQEFSKQAGHTVFRATRPLSAIPRQAVAPKPAPVPPPAPKPPEEKTEAKPEPAKLEEPHEAVAAKAAAEATAPKEPEASAAEVQKKEAPKREPRPKTKPGHEDIPAPEALAEPPAPVEKEPQAAKQGEPVPIAMPPQPVVRPAGVPLVHRQPQPQGPRGPRIHYGPGVKAPPPGSQQPVLETLHLERERRAAQKHVYDRTPSAAAMEAAAKDAALQSLRPAQAAPPPQSQRPSPYAPPSAESRRKTKRERRFEKQQARVDRRDRLEQELAEARATAETGEAVFIREGITVKELAEKLNQKVRDVIAKLMMQGIMVTINQPLEAEVAVQVCNMFGFAAEVISFEDELTLTKEAPSDAERVTRAPVVTVMGHVDHGKSSLLEAIHHIDITSKEFGGITQHIGAYKVEHKDRTYVFLDTPGHAAFTLMRARGAKVTDIVILVVAADDGVMPQTIEAINHCKAANVPMVVAINKMDKPGADPDRVKRELSQHGVLTEDWGGDVVWCPVSAKQKQGIEELLEMVTLVADMLNLTAVPGQPCSGTVLEARLDRSRGPVATVLVQDGTLRVGDFFLCGATYGRVRGLFDDRGAKLESAGPSTPVEVLGFSEVPAVGAVFQGMEDEAKARQVAEYRKEQDKAKSLRTSRVSLDNVFGQIKQGEMQELALILKADVQGSLEAVAKQVADCSTEEIKVRVVHSGVGAVSESDVLLAAASGAVIIGFNVRPDRKAAELAKSEGVDIKLYTVIYDLVDELKKALTGMLKPIEREVILGHADVRQIFKVSGVGTIAGCVVSDGHVTRQAQVRLLRDNVIVHTGKLASLKRFKDDASEVKEGTECGIGIENYNDIKPGDVIEAFETQLEARTLGV